VLPKIGIHAKCYKQRNVMKEMQSAPLPLSKKLLIIVLICLGFAPWSVECIAFALGDYLRWAQIYRNEEVAWTAIFTVFHLAALALCIWNFRKSPAFCTIPGLIAFVGTIWGLSAIGSVGEPSSKMDAPNLELTRFWLGGGWLTGVYLVPLLAVYLSVLLLEILRRKKST
jgi:hypothetical protein